MGKCSIYMPTCSSYYLGQANNQEAEPFKSEKLSPIKSIFHEHFI